MSSVVRKIRKLSEEQLGLADNAAAHGLESDRDAYLYTARVLHALSASTLPPSAETARRWAREERQAAEHYRAHLPHLAQYATEARFAATVLDRLADDLSA